MLRKKRKGSYETHTVSDKVSTLLNRYLSKNKFSDSRVQYYNTKRKKRLWQIGSVALLGTLALAWFIWKSAQGFLLFSS